MNEMSDHQIGQPRLHDGWERLLRQGNGLLEQFARDNRFRIRQPKYNMEKRLSVR
jgi:hypothetical protein